MSCNEEFGQARWKVLVIGGTQFMGRILVSRLLNEHKAEVTLVNRGKSPNPFEGKVKVLQCDRINDRKRFRDIIEKNSSGIDAIIDFVAFSESHVSDVVNAAGEIGIYILISSDSVYMPCLSPFDPENPREPIKEEAGVEPIDPKERSRLAKRNSYQAKYGRGKLCAESALKATKKFPSVSLRISDVIGPFDNIGSHLDLQQKILAGEPLGTNGDRLRIPLVGASDAVDAIIKCIEGRRQFRGTTSYNICCDETLTVQEYATAVAECLGVDLRGLEFDPREDSDLGSVDIGPVCNHLVRRELGWTPRPVRQVIAETVAWYQESVENVLYTLGKSQEGSSSEESSSDEEEAGIKRKTSEGSEWDSIHPVEQRTFRFDFGMEN